MYMVRLGEGNGTCYECSCWYLQSGGEEPQGIAISVPLGILVESVELPVGTTNEFKEICGDFVMLHGHYSLLKQTRKKITSVHMHTWILKY